MKERRLDADIREPPADLSEATCDLMASKVYRRTRFIETNKSREYAFEAGGVIRCPDAISCRAPAKARGASVK